MTDYLIDIIIPIWNRPLEVRSALASFVSNSPMARLVMVNNESERETETILHEFAEALDDRALLVATGRNIGSVASLNLGLTKSTAPFVLLTNPYTRLEQGWFDPVKALFESHPDVGSVVLKKRVKALGPDSLEADSGSFDAMILKRSLYEAAGGFDERMDGGEWTLRDYARRALFFGYTTFMIRSSHLEVVTHTEFGSVARRDENSRLARMTYNGRWGEPQTFVFNCAETFFGVDAEHVKVFLLASARQGNRFNVIVGSSIAKKLSIVFGGDLHENISFHPLPRFFSSKALRRIAEIAVVTEPSSVLVSDSEHFPVDMKRVSFSDFMGILEHSKEHYYRKGIL